MTDNHTPRNAEWIETITPAEFAKLIGLEGIAPGRVSSLLVRQLQDELLNNELNPARVVQEISALEAGSASSLKPPIQNKYPPLKGLWHKHYAEPGIRSLALNVKKGLTTYGIPYFSQKMRESQISGEVQYVSVKDIPAIANDIVSGNLSRLAAKSARCGEWLVFAKHQGKNYYLSLATHDKETHESIRRDIDQVCCQEFEFLAELLASA